MQVDKKILNQLNKKIDQQVALVNSFHTQTISAKDKYTGIIGLDFISRMQEKMLGQRIVISEVIEKQAEAELALLKTIKSLAYISEHSELPRDINPVEQLDTSKSISKNIMADIKNGEK